MRSKIMSIAKGIFLGSLLFFSFLCSAQNSFTEIEIEISEDSNVSIYGDAGVADFTCRFDMDFHEAPATILYKEQTGEIAFENAALVLRNEGFDCGNTSRNEDFLEMVKTREYPEMTLTLEKIILKKEDEVLAYVNINIAGKSNSYTIPVNVKQNRPLRIAMQFKINVLDFGLEPITKMFGLIKVDEVIDINLDLRIDFPGETSGLGKTKNNKL